MASERAGRILVTGAGGLLGQAVTRELFDAGYEVVALDRAVIAPLEGVRFVQDDLSSRERLEVLLTEVGGIVHCAAYAHLGAAREDILFNANVASTANLLFAAETAGVSRVIYASSQSALGFAYAPEIIAPDRLPVDEQQKPQPLEGYALSKLVGEQLCELVSARSALVTGALRFPVIWHPERFAEHVAKRLGDPKQAAKSQWAYVDVRDAARACRLAFEALTGAAFSLYNIAAPWPFACDDPEATITAAYGNLPVRPGWRPGDAVYDSSKAQSELGFRAIWRWSPDGIQAHPAG
jgi:UDP-glucose 4-epimerase